MDCLRADRVSRFGHHRETTPFLDDLDALAFSSAKSPSSWTFPAVSSMLSGLYTHEHGAGFRGVERTWEKLQNDELHSLSESVKTLPDVLQENGYETCCYSGIETALTAVGDRFGTTHCEHHVDGRELVEPFLEWWDDVDASSGRFGYFHLADLHGWDVTQSEDDRRFAAAQPFGSPDYLPPRDAVDWNDTDERSEYLQRFARIYDNQLYAVDRRIESLFDELQRRGDYEDTLIVVAGDHGEAFGEHYELSRTEINPHRSAPYGLAHGSVLFEEGVNVPLFVVNAGVTGERSEAVSTIDIFPTVLDELGIEGDHESSGRPLGTTTPDRRIHTGGIGDGYEQKAVYSGPYKLIKQFHDGTTLLYDLEADPGEENPLDAGKVESDLERAVPRFGDRPTDQRMDIADETIERLERLGYR